MKHQYQIITRWTGNTGAGTADYKAYSRDHEYSAPNKYDKLLGSSDPAFRGDPNRYNPEELLVASVASCHMLWYLHLCTVAGITVLEYTDEAMGEMEEASDGSGRFTRIILFPRVKILEKDKRHQATMLHEQAHKMCFIANSCNFPIYHEPQITVSGH